MLCPVAFLGGWLHSHAPDLGLFRQGLVQNSLRRPEAEREVARQGAPTRRYNGKYRRGGATQHGGFAAGRSQDGGLKQPLIIPPTEDAIMAKSPGDSTERVTKIVEVAAAIVLHAGKVLVARRPPGGHLEGLWEFPGGKIRAGESPRDAVRREVAEEVGLDVLDTVYLHHQEFEYPERRVSLSFFLVDRFTGDATGRDGQEIRWVDVQKLTEVEMPAANREVVRMLMAQFS